MIKMAPREGGKTRPHQGFRRRGWRSRNNRAATIIENFARTAGALRQFVAFLKE
jgi:hypothetical protein